MSKISEKIAGRFGSVKTPGVPSGDETDNEQLVGGADPLEPLPGDADPEQPLVLTHAQLQAAINRGVNAALDARAKASAPLKEADLPDQTEIDPAKIKRPTLSKQGYVVPANYGEPADPSIKR